MPPALIGLAAFLSLAVCLDVFLCELELDPVTRQEWPHS